MSNNYLELNDEDFNKLKTNLKKKNEKNKKIDKLRENNNKFINKILEKGKKELNYLKNNSKYKIINELKDKIKELDSSEKFNEDKFNNFF